MCRLTTSSISRSHRCQHGLLKVASFWFVQLFSAKPYQLVANVPDAESQFHAHEFLDATVQPKPIYISPNEIYTMHELISKHLDGLVRIGYRPSIARRLTNSRLLGRKIPSDRSYWNWMVSLTSVMKA